MKARGIRNALVAGILGFLVIAGSSVGVAGYGLQRVGGTLARELEFQMKERMNDLSFSLAKLATTGQKKKDLVLLSETMMDLVDSSASTSDRLQIQEVLYINSKGELLAHNDVTFLAKSAQKKYDTPEYLSVFARPKRDPVEINSIETAKKPEGLLEKTVYDLLNQSHPYLLTTEFRVGAAVYMTDGIIPAGGLHVIYHSVMQESAFLAIVDSIRDTLRAGLLSGLILMIPAALLAYFFTASGTARNSIHTAMTDYGVIYPATPAATPSDDDVDVVATPMEMELDSMNGIHHESSQGDPVIHDFSEKLSSDGLAVMLDEEMPGDLSSTSSSAQILSNDMEGDDEDEDIIVFRATTTDGATVESTANHRFESNTEVPEVGTDDRKVVPLKRKRGAPVRGRIVDAIPLNRV